MCEVAQRKIFSRLYIRIDVHIKVTLNFGDTSLYIVV